MKFCKDCVHFKFDIRWPTQPICEASKGKIDMVTGDEVDPLYCATMRQFDGKGYCGAIAILFEAKQ